MRPPLALEFTKMHGAGNDFIVFDNRAYHLSDEDLAELAETWCPRRYGVGADGLLALDEAESTEAAYRMRYVNADGSWAAMCGNGARCLVQFALASDFEGPELTFETDAGRYHATVPEEASDRVRLYVPSASRLALDVTMDVDPPAPMHFVHTGTEHLVAFVPDLAAAPVEKWGASLRTDPCVQPEGANVNFAAVEADGALRVRTYEKGVEGETLSCGTGVLAAAVVAEATNRTTADPVTVHTQGGTLTVGTAATRRGEERYLEGPVVTVFRGSLSLR